MSAPESLPNIAETPVGPLGGWLNIDGNEVPLDLVAPRDKKAEELVRRLLTEASALNETLAQFRERAMADIQDFRDWSIRKCGIRSRAKKGCCTLYSYDGSLRVDLHTAGVLSLNERIEAVRAHIAECLDDITAGAADVAATRALVDAAFATDSARRAQRRQGAEPAARAHQAPGLGEGHEGARRSDRRNRPRQLRPLLPPRRQRSAAEVGRDSAGAECGVRWRHEIDPAYRTQARLRLDWPARANTARNAQRIRVCAGGRHRHVHSAARCRHWIGAGIRPMCVLRRTDSRLWRPC